MGIASNGIKTNDIERLMSLAPSYPGNEFETKIYAQDFMAKYGLPKDAEIFFDELTKKITIIWRGEENMDVFREKFPVQFHRDEWLGCPIQKAKLEFSPNQTILLETVFFGRTGWGKAYASPNFLVQQGAVSCEENQLAIHIKKAFETADFPFNHERYDW